MTASKIKVALVPGWASQPGTLFYYMNKKTYPIMKPWENNISFL